jgi:hypothetical protein
MSDEDILDDVIETFSDEDTLLSDIQNNPVKWLLSLAVIVPGMAYTLSGKTSYEAALVAWGLPTGLNWILACFVAGQIFIAPLACYFLTRTGNAASGLFIAMGGSVILLSGLVSSPGQFYLIPAFLGLPFSVALSVPMLLVLKSKKKLLDPGSKRLIQCTLLSMAILFYATAVFPFAEMAFCAESIDDTGPLIDETNVVSGLIDPCANYNYIPFALILGTVAAIGWAWPRGAKSPEKEICPNCGSKNCCLNQSKINDTNSINGTKDSENNDTQSDDTQQDTSAKSRTGGKKIIDDLSDDFLDGLKD